MYYADIENDGINTGSSAGIRGVPTLILYKKGIEVARKVGGVPESSLERHQLYVLSLIHISEPTRRYAISYAVFCLNTKI